jgi:uncharacterized membrane protein
MNAWFGLDKVFVLVGLVALGVAALTLSDRHHPRRWSTALFWGLFGAIVIGGDPLVATLGKPAAHQLVGAAVILMALIAGAGGLRASRPPSQAPAERQARAQRLGHGLLLLALMMPALTVLLSLGLKSATVGGRPLFDPHNLTLCALSVAVLLSLGAIGLLTRDTPVQAVREARRLLDTIGWAALLPQMLAMLGGVFVVAHTGEAIQALARLVVNPDHRLWIVATYCVGMAAFTMVMGNAFAAFPVMTAGIALPLLVRGLHADPAPVMTLGMLAGYCGTLMTPMAANFNIVPAALLELKDRHLIIKTQIPTALIMLVANIVLMDLLAFR